MEIFSYKSYVLDLGQVIQNNISSLTQKPTLGIAQSGNYESSIKYIKIKKEFCENIGINVKEITLSQDFDRAEKEINEFIHTNTLNGIIIQLPLPSQEMYSLLNAIPKDLDVDLLSEESKQAFYCGDFSKLPPVVRCVDFFLEKCNLKYIRGKVCLVGNGDLVGKPCAYYLKSLGFEVEVCTNYVSGKKIDAEIVILGVGSPGLIDPTDIKEGSHVIDLGSAVVEGKTVGDLDMTNGEESMQHLGYVAPSPGGLGPLTVRFLVMNLLNI